MSINEIWAPEALAVIFMIVPLLRPLIKALWPLDGLVWLPFVAMGILVAIFPAYGFRPEVIPALVFAVFFNLANLSAFIRSKMGRAGDRFDEREPLRSVAGLVLLAIVAVPMFAFAPRVHVGRGEEAEPARNLAVPRGLFDREYVLRIHGPVDANRPLIFIVPPDVGSAASVELISERLRDKGFTVVTYSRKDYDAVFIDENGRRRASPAKLLGHWRVFRRAAVFATANERGRELEAERRSDLEFLLPQLPALLGVAGQDDLPPILFVGYGAGGSALAYMAGESQFAERHSNALGVVAVESRLWSSYQEIPRTIEPLTATGMLPRLLTNIGNWFDERRRSRVSPTGPLPEPGLPVLYVVSGRALDTSRRQNAYQAVFHALRSGYGPVALAAIESAGPLDYQDFPLTQPMLSFFFSAGSRGAGRSADPIGDTAGIIGNFASYLLERKQEAGDLDETEEIEQEVPAKREINIPPRSAIRGAVHLENRGLPEFRFF